MPLTASYSKRDDFSKIFDEFYDRLADVFSQNEETFASLVEIMRDELQISHAERKVAKRCKYLSVKARIILQRLNMMIKRGKNPGNTLEKIAFSAYHHDEMMAEAIICKVSMLL